MNGGNTGSLLLALVLMAVAGSVDAIGFLKLDHFFVSFVSGDSTQLAVALSRGDWSKASAPALIVGSFFTGVVTGRLIVAWAAGWCRQAVLLTEAVLLTLAVLTGGSTVGLIVPMVLAMGIQNAAVHKAGQTKLALTYVTGTVVNCGEKFAEALIGRAGTDRRAWIPYASLWGALIAGALAGARAFESWGLRGVAVPIAVILVTALVDTLVQRR